MVEWGRLLSGYWGEILSRRFESCPPRHIQKRVHHGRVSSSQDRAGSKLAYGFPRDCAQ